MREVYGTIRRFRCNIKIQRILFCGRSHTYDNGISGASYENYKGHLSKACKEIQILNSSNIEHDIRTIVNVCWENHRERLEQIAGYPLEYRPTNSEFIDMIAFHLGSEKERNTPDLGFRKDSPGKIMENIFSVTLYFFHR